MRMKATATLKTMTLCAAMLSVMVTALPAGATGGTDDCDPAKCTSPVVGASHHENRETR